MKSPILSAQEIRDWDAFTIENEPISSINLMERAASTCAAWIQKRWNSSQSVGILCGPGNNGGDGLVIARLLLKEGFKVQVYLLKFSDLSDDTQQNFEKLDELNVQVIDPKKSKANIEEFDIYIDALFGTGLSREIESPLDSWVHEFNQKEGVKIAVDMPSGVFSDNEKQPEVTIKADHTLTFQCWKKVMIYPENQSVFGSIQLMDIGLISHYPLLKDHSLWLVKEGGEVLKNDGWSNTIHKYNRGYVFIIAGSAGMKGARVLAVQGAQSVGAGMIEVMDENEGYFPIPEAITQHLVEDEPPNIKEKVSSIVCGSGLGKRAQEMVKQLEGFMQCPVIFDADAINAISVLKGYDFPNHCILTPHQGELKRLIGAWQSEEDMLNKTNAYSKTHGVVIVVKGPLSKIITPNQIYVNTTGNNLLATAGSGDFLAGMIGGFAAQGDALEKAAIKAVFYHGQSADIWRDKHAGKFLAASNLADYVIIK